MIKQRHSAGFIYSRSSSKQSFIGKIIKNPRYSSEQKHPSLNYHQYASHMRELSAMRAHNSSSRHTKSITELKNLAKYSTQCTIPKSIIQHEARYAKMVASYQEKKKIISEELEKIRAIPKHKLYQQIKENVLVSQNPQKTIEKPKKNIKNEHFVWIAFKKQIKYDQIVRILKHNINPQQSAQFQALNIDICLTSDQIDPFYQKKTVPTQQLIRQLSQAQNNAQEFWKSQIKGKVNLKDAEELFKTINFQKKTQIDLKEFTREVGLQLSTHLKVRDVLAIFIRFTAHSQRSLTKEIFVKTLTQRN